MDNNYYSQGSGVNIAEILETIADVFYALDADFRYTYVNKKAEEAWGKRHDEVLGKTIWEVFPQVSGSESEQMHLTAMKHREVLHYETISTILKRWISVGIFPARSGGLYVFYQEIEVRKQAEQMLRNNEARARILADAIPHIIWTNTVAGVADYFNKRWYDYTDLSYDQSVGLGWEAVVHPDDAALSKARWARALVDAEVFDTEYRLRRHDGSYRWFIGRNVPLRNEAGEVTGWFGSATDIEDLKQAQESLARSEERMRITTESAIDYAIIGMDTERHVQSWSRGAERIFGYAEAEAIGQAADIIFTPEDRAAGVPQKEMETARDEGMSPDERWHLRKSGERFYLSGVMRPIYNAGAITGYVKVARDFTDHKQMEEQREEFISVASHELKTPISSLKAYGEILQDILAESGDEQSATLLSKMEGQIDRLTNLVSALLDVTSIREGKLKLQKTSFNLDVLLRELAEELQVTTPIRLQIVESVPVTVTADRKCIMQVIVNLLSNAIKYSRGTEHVDLSLTTYADEAVCCVRDYGIGINRKDSEQVFERFYRAQSAAAGTYPGLGLGLYISAELVRLHGGRIWLESEIEQGSRFCFSLPL